MSKKRPSYTPTFKFQVVLEVLKKEAQAAEIARNYGIHPVTASNWKKKFIENGAQVFGADQSIKQLEDRIAQLERMLGQKEVEIALLKNFLHGN